MNYQEFLKSKIDIAKDTGFDISLDEINSVLLPHQKDAVRWAIKGGRRALFESWGLGKTCQELEICRIITEHEGAQGFPEDYVIDRDHTGKAYPKSAQVARCGNAVPPPFAEALVRANLPEMCMRVDQKRQIS